MSDGPTNKNGYLVEAVLRACDLLEAFQVAGEPLRLRVETSRDPCRIPATAAGGAPGVAGADHCDANEPARRPGRRYHGFDCTTEPDEAMAEAGHA